MKFGKMYNKKMRNKIDEVNFYGTDENYIHCKFGHLYKMYNFTDDFIEEYPRFFEEYKKYFNGEDSLFKNGLALVNYIRRYKIPVYLYFNFTDEPCRKWEEIYSWLIDNYVGGDELYKFDYDKHCYIDLDGHELEDK